jgi:hypothetical protein
MDIRDCCKVGGFLILAVGFLVLLFPSASSLNPKEAMVLASVIGFIFLSIGFRIGIKWLFFDVGQLSLLAIFYLSAEPFAYIYIVPIVCFFVYMAIEQIQKAGFQKENTETKKELKDSQFLSYDHIMNDKKF